MLPLQQLVAVPIQLYFAYQGQDLAFEHHSRLAFSQGAIEHPAADARFRSAWLCSPLIS